MRLFLLVPFAILAGCSTQSAQNSAEKTDDVAALVKNDDPAACAAPLAITTALAAAYQPYRDAINEGMPPLPVDTISATAVNKDIHEITCSATAHIKAAFPETQRFNYKLRPSLDAGGGFVAEVFADQSLITGLRLAIFSWKEGQKRAANEVPENLTADVVLGDAEDAADNADAVEPQELPPYPVQHFTALEKQAIKRAADLESDCRGGGSPAAEKACDTRYAAMDEVFKLGICWGREGEPYAAYEYHRCGPGSLGGDTKK